MILIQPFLIDPSAACQKGGRTSGGITYRAALKLHSRESQDEGQLLYTLPAVHTNPVAGGRVRDHTAGKALGYTSNANIILRFTSKARQTLLILLWFTYC